MTEQETMIRLDFIRCALLGGTKPEIIPNEDNVELMDNAIKALEEVQKYRAIGTVEKVREYKEIADNMDAVSLAALCISLNKLKEYQKIGTPDECLAAVEKQRAKKPIEPDEEYGTFKCPNCGGLIFTEDRFETHKYCLLCGQKLDWSDE